MTLIETTRPATSPSSPISESRGGSTTTGHDQFRSGTHSARVVPGSSTTQGQIPRGTHPQPALGSLPEHDHSASEAHGSVVVFGSTPAPDHAFPITQRSAVGGGQQLGSSQTRRETQASAAAVISSPPPKLETQPTDIAAAGNLFDGYLCLVADTLDDLERTRIANENRVRQLTRAQHDADGEQRGLGLDARSPEVARAQALVASIAQLEKDATKDLARALKKHPLYPTIRDMKGVGDKQAARLLAAIGDPYWNDLHERPRTVSELWAYCGLAVHDGRAQRRTKGVKSNWSDTAKMRVWNVANSCLKAGIRKDDDAPAEFSPDTRTGITRYGQAYIDRRTATAERVHTADCVRCGPAGKPALAGTPWSNAHKQADALRIVGKEVLKDLWIAARAIHQDGDNS